MRRSEKDSRRFAKTLRKDMTPAEAILWSQLRRKGLDGVKFRRQHPIGRYIADFACVSAKLVVEVDGATHATPEEISHDQERTRYMSNGGWRVIRVGNTDIYKNLDGVWLTIAHHLAVAPPPSSSAARPTLPPQAGEEE